MGVFSYEWYTDFLAELKQKGYRFGFFNETYPERCCWLRHDVDLCLSSAFKMASVEKKAGVRSTFFFRFDSPTYSLFEDDGIVSAILRLGHRVGLHLPDNRLSLLDRLLPIFCSLFFVRSLASPQLLSLVPSIHKPGCVPIGHTTYGHPFFGEGVQYISDSRGVFSPGPLTGGKIQLLTHPVWWADKGGRKPVDVVIDTLNHTQTIQTRQVLKDIFPCDY